MLAFSQVTFEQSNELERIEDIVGFDEDLLTFASDLSFGFSIFDLNLEIDPDYERIMSTSRLDTVSELRKELDGLRNSYGGLGSDLYDALDKVGKKLQEIRGMEEPIDIGVLEDCMENSKGSGIVDQLEDNFIDRIEESEYQYEKKIAKVLKMAESIEKKYDYLEYVMGKVRLYSREGIKDELAFKIREIILTLTDGERISAIDGLLDLLRKVKIYSNNYIKGSEADRIRYKTDYILRKVSDSQTVNTIDIDVSTALSGIDLQVNLEEKRVNHIAPSDDKITQAIEFGAEPGGDKWRGSFSYRFEDRDYLDELSDDDDRLINKLEIESEKEYDFFDLAGMMSFKKSAFPNEIGDEIELAKVEKSKAAIDDLIQYIKAQNLDDDVENELTEELEDAEAYLDTEDREAREEAVDSLEDFLEEVEDQFWENNLSKTLFNKLTKCGKKFLPRESRQFFKISGESDFAWKSHQFTIFLENERRKYPVDSEKDRIIKAREIEYAHQFDNFTVGCLIEYEKTRYFLTPDSNKRKFQRQIEAELDQDKIDLLGSYNRERTSYPNALYKNKSLSERILEVEIDTYLTITWESNRKIYPHNSYKNWSARETSVEVDLAPINLVWETELKEYPNNSTKNLYSHTLEISMGKKILEGISFEATVEYTDKNYPHNPYKNAENASFTTTLECEF